MLTVEELKALKVGDWIWIVEKTGTSQNLCNGRYFVKCLQSQEMQDLQTSFLGKTIHNNLGSYFWYKNYGKSWIAYKNKEEAENEDLVTIDSVAKVLAEMFEEEPCCFGDNAEYMANCSDWCEKNCNTANSNKCWKKFLQIKLGVLPEETELELKFLTNKEKNDA